MRTDGAFPQTWEDPAATHPETKAKGDNDPLDVCEIGEAVGYCGQVKQVKVLGIMALLDEGETDWKVLVIDVNDPLAGKLNDIEDVERHLPGLIRASNECECCRTLVTRLQCALSKSLTSSCVLPQLAGFRIYKIPDGKPENQFAFSGEAKNKRYATEIIHECNEAWKKLIAGNADHAAHKVNMWVASLICLEGLRQHTSGAETDWPFCACDLSVCTSCAQRQYHQQELARPPREGRGRLEDPRRLEAAPCRHRVVHRQVVLHQRQRLCIDAEKSIRRRCPRACRPGALSRSERREKRPYLAKQHD